MCVCVFVILIIFLILQLEQHEYVFITMCFQVLRNKWCIYDWKISKDFLRKWPETWILTKRNSNEYVKQDWWQTEANFLRKWSKIGISTYFGTQNDPKIRPLMPLFYTLISSSSNQLIIQVRCETFWENLNFDQFGGPKIGSLRSNLHTSKSSPNELLTQVSCESNGNFSRK